jgi:hypothetical protein
MTATLPALNDGAVFEELVETALGDSGFAWKRRDDHWVVPATERLPREVQVTRTPTGVRVQATLAEWDEAGATEMAALSCVLTRAQAELRFARCELEAGVARAVALVEADHLEADLAHSVGAVAAAVCLLANEVGALLTLAVARRVLDFFGGEKPAAVAP